MIVRYEVGFTDNGWYQNTDAFHHLRDAIDAARALVSETIPAEDVRITEQHFRTEAEYLKRYNMRRSIEMGLDEADKLLRDQNQSPSPFIPHKARYAISSAAQLTILDVGNRHLATIHQDAPPHDATVRHVIKHWTMYASDAAIASCPICGEVCGNGVLIDPPSGCRYGFCRNLKQSYDMYERDGAGQDLTREQLQSLLGRAALEATVALLTKSQNPEYRTTIGAFFADAVEDVHGMHENIQTTDQLLDRAEDIGADIMELLLRRVKQEFLPHWWGDVLTGIVSKHVHLTAEAA
ncbi:MAG: hypothetical protein OXG68_02295 [Chloroflexi bacterium]|nr:hypothetical protein [Chloroflexota bacterium]